MFVVHSFNFMDFEDADEPIKRGVSTNGPHMLMNEKLEIDVDIQLHFASFHDTLINPIQIGDDAEDYFTSVESIDSESVIVPESVDSRPIDLKLTIGLKGHVKV